MVNRPLRAFLPSCTAFAWMLAAVLPVALPALSGCAPHRTLEDELIRSGRAVGDAARWRTFDAEEPVELKTTGALAVEVDNFAGPVVIRADRKVESTFVEVRRVARHGLGRWNESREALETAQWTATLEPRAGGGETLVVRTDTPDAEKHFQSMEILVVTPALDTVKVRSTRGGVTVIENRGVVDIETTRGDVRVLTPWPMTGPMTVVTSEGSIDYRVRGESRGVFDCESRGGEVRQRAEFGKWVALEKGNDHDRFRAVLNDGTNPVVLRTTEQPIRVAIVPDPTKVGPIIRDP